MARLDLIDQYIADLRGYVSPSQRADEICAEAEDHLLATVERHVANGMDPEQAQRRALADYGAVRRVAREFLRTPSGHLALPTRTTNTAGAAALTAAALWVVFALLTLRFGDGTSLPPGSLWGLSVLACGFTFWGLSGLVIRHGGTYGLLGQSASWSSMLLLPAPVFAFSIWGVPAYLALLVIVTYVFGMALWDAGLAPAAATLAFAMGPPITACAFWATTLAVGRVPAGPVTMFGHPTNELFSIYGGVPAAVGLVIMAIGLAGLGRWLRAETPQEDLQHVTA